MELAALYIGIAVVLGLYMTWGIGANDVANAMGTSVGSGAVSVGLAIGIAAVFEFSGAVLAGGHVTGTIRKGIIDPGAVADPEMLVLGMLAALLAAGLWLMLASSRGWPVSTTHTIVGAILGFGVVGLGIDAIDWAEMSAIVASWVVSPVLGGTFAYLLSISVRRLILDDDRPMRAAVRWGPVYVFLMGTLISLITLYKGLAHLDLELGAGQTLLVALVVGGLVAAVGRALIARVRVEPAAELDFHYAGVEKVFAPLCVFTACSMAFAHGSNDVANGVGPLAAVVGVARTSLVTDESELPVWVLMLGAVGIVLGLATLGHRVMRTIGKRITELTPTRGFCAEMAAAATVVVASRLGLPVSTTHIIVGAVMGVGMARGIGAIDLRVVGGIVVSWLVTVPLGAVLAGGFFLMFRAIFG